MNKITILIKLTLINSLINHEKIIYTYLYTPTHIQMSINIYKLIILRFTHDGGMRLNLLGTKAIAALEENVKQSFVKVKDELSEHLEAINDNTREIHDTNDQLALLEAKVDKLSDKMDQILSLISQQKTYSVESLSLREQEIFVALYTKNEPLSLPQISRRTGLPIEMIKELITQIIEKGIPLVKRLLDDDIVIEIDPGFREHQTKTNILQLNEQLMKYMC